MAVYRSNPCRSAAQSRMKTAMAGRSRATDRTRFVPPVTAADPARRRRYQRRGLRDVGDQRRGRESTMILSPAPHRGHEMVLSAATTNPNRRRRTPRQPRKSSGSAYASTSGRGAAHVEIRHGRAESGVARWAQRGGLATERATQVDNGLALLSARLGRGCATVWPSGYRETPLRSGST